VVVLVLGWYLFMLKTPAPPPHPGGLEPLRVSVNSWVGFGPLYLAAKRHLFEQHGLQVEIVRLESGPDRRSALISRRVDLLGASLDDFAVTVDEGVDAVAISCADFSNGADGIIAGKGIDSLADLAKSQVAVQPGLPNHFFLLYVLDQAGISTKGLKLLPMQPDDAGAAFIAGHINAAVTWEPHLSRALRSSKYPEAILDLFIARKDWTEAHQQTLAKFRSSWDEAVSFVAQNATQSDELLAGDLGLKPDEVGAALAGVSLLSNTSCRALLEPKIQKLGATVERLWNEAGYLKRTTDLAPRMRLR
jgi:NitT/TauT family transport system substrate-binding protein